MAVGESGAVSTPCVKTCVIGSDGLCRGCARTLEEIVAWARLDEPARHAVMADLPRRRATRPRPASPSR
jgi:predicted Fe-S protein YdhL (DUF1289 family)